MLAFKISKATTYLEQQWDCRWIVVVLSRRRRCRYRARRRSTLPGILRDHISPVLVAGQRWTSAWRCRRPLRWCRRSRPGRWACPCAANRRLCWASCDSGESPCHPPLTSCWALPPLTSLVDKRKRFDKWRINNSEASKTSVKREQYQPHSHYDSSILQVWPWTWP